MAALLPSELLDSSDHHRWILAIILEKAEELIKKVPANVSGF